jgi:hypothetical protein
MVEDRTSHSVEKIISPDKDIHGNSPEYPAAEEPAADNLQHISVPVRRIVARVLRARRIREFERGRK